MTDDDRWWQIYGELYELWAASRLADSRALLDASLPDFGHQPTAKLAEARQLVLETGYKPDAATRRRVLELIDDAVAEGQDHADALAVAIELVCQLGEWDRTWRYLAQLDPLMHELDPDNFAIVAFTRGYVLARADRREEAEQQFRAAIEANPDEQRYRDALEHLHRTSEQWLLRYGRGNASTTGGGTVTMRLPDTPPDDDWD